MLAQRCSGVQTHRLVVARVAPVHEVPTIAKNEGDVVANDEAAAAGPSAVGVARTAAAAVATFATLASFGGVATAS